MSISMKRILFLSLLMCALMLTRQNVWADGVAHVAFWETFDVNNGSGGRDGQFSGNIASSNIHYDIDGWSGSSIKGAKACLMFGTTAGNGSCTTPEIVLIGTAKTATLTFNAAGWGDGGTNLLTVTANEGVTLSGNTEITLKNGEWTLYTITITLTTAKSAQLTFTGKRGFLDDVKVEENVTAINAPTLTESHDFWPNTTETAKEIITLEPSDSTTVYYTTDGTEPSPTNGSVATLTSNVIITGTTTVKARAYYGEIASSVVEKHYEVGQTVNSIEEFRENPDDVELRVFFADNNENETRVLFYDQSSNQLFLRENTTAFCIDFGTTATFNPVPEYNQHVAGWIVGRKTTENGVLKLVPTNNTVTDYLAFAEAVKESTVAPFTIYNEELDGHISNWVTITDQRVGTDITLSDRFGTNAYDGAIVDVSGIVIPDGSTSLAVAPFTQNYFKGVVYVIDENKEFVSPTSDIQHANVRLKRSLSKDNWNTFALPFDASIAGNLREYDCSNGNTMVFKEATTIEAGKPYLIKPSNNMVNPEWEDVTLKATSAQTVSSNDYSFVAVYSPTDLVTDKSELFLKSDSKLYYPSSSGAHLRGMRAFFRVPVGQTARLALSDGEMITGVDMLGAERETKGEVYNLNGQRVLKPKKGLYIVRSSEALLQGKNKIIIR